MNLGVMAMKGYSILPRSPELKPHYQMQPRTIPEIQGSLGTVEWKEVIEVLFLFTLLIFAIDGKLTFWISPYDVNNLLLYQISDLSLSLSLSQSLSQSLSLFEFFSILLPTFTFLHNLKSWVFCDLLLSHYEIEANFFFLAGRIILKGNHA